MTRHPPTTEIRIVLRTILSAGVLAVPLACTGAAAGATWVVDDGGGAVVCLAAILLGGIEQDGEMMKPAETELVLSDYPELFEKDMMIVVGSNASGMEGTRRDEGEMATEYLQSPKAKPDNAIAFPNYTGTFSTFHQAANYVNGGNFSMRTSIESPEFSIKNTGNATLTNISIIKDGKIIVQLPKLEVNKSENLSVKNINGINCEKDKPTAQNEGWLLVTCDQGIEKKLVYWYVVRHAPIPSTQEVLVHKILPLILLVLITFFGAIFINRIRGGKR